MSVFRDPALLQRAVDLASSFLERLPDRPAGATASLDDLRRALGGPLPDGPADPRRVIEELVSAGEPGLASTAGPRFFGFVIGGAFPVSVAADWLTTAWDQPASAYVLSPTAAVVEEVAAGWIASLLGLPDDVSAGFVTGCHTANFTALAAARHEVLRREGWDVEARGLQGAPAVTVLLGQEAHVSIFGALRMLGLGAATAQRIEADDQGRMNPAALERALAAARPPIIVCAQAGNVNTGAFDPLAPIAAATRARGAWLHIDGAFGLWAAAHPGLRHHLAGIELADSWATDAHKWLNVPYDSGLVFTAHAAAHRAAMSLTAAYLVRGAGEERIAMDWVPESSRRARGFPIYATLKTIGRQGVVDLVDRCCRLARRMAHRLGAHPSVRILNDVVLNQVLFDLKPSGGRDHDTFISDVVGRVQREGTCWIGGTAWHGRPAIRVSVSNWATAEEDVDRSARAILAAVDEADGSQARGSRLREG
ncbi:MAG: aspartate aminotransferase family protein [Acidobacteriota bacterium]|nr:aspartate aminotransferase family protein [Acidobacteriota bacterium]